MADKKIIAVVGATGQQGGGLARAILADSNSAFGVRAITRNPDGEAARALARAGAEVVQADLDDASSVARAFEGAHGAFLVTNFWESFSADREQAQIRTLAAEARRAGLAHVVWSTLDDTREFIPLDDERMPTLQGRFKVPHYDSKGEADAYFREAGVPTTFLRTSYYWENIIYFGHAPKHGEDGTLEFVLPLADKKLPGIAAADIGKAAYAIFRGGADMVGRTIGIAGGHLTGAQMAEGLSEALGERVIYRDIAPATYRALGFPGADDMGNMFQFKQEFEAEYCGRRPLDATRALVPDLQSFADWAKANADRIPIEALTG